MMATRIGKLSIRRPSALHAAARVGLVALAIAILGVTPARAGVPDPTLLPVATTSQAPLTSAYNTLGVASMAAGISYAVFCLKKKTSFMLNLIFRQLAYPTAVSVAVSCL